jgi:hypothetical protein
MIFAGTIRSASSAAYDQKSSMIEKLTELIVRAATTTVRDLK